MHKNAKITTAAILGALIMGGASGCGAKSDLVLWTGFGAAYTTKLNSTMVEPYCAEKGITIENQSQGSYDKLQSNLNNSISTATYPNFANGYPDHFAGYIKSNIQVPLDDYIDAYNTAHNVNLLEDYYPEYMVENQSLKYKDDGTGYIMGLPFNKSTEVMGYNGIFMEYAQSIDSDIKVPETWAEWEVQGPKMLKVMDTLYEKYLFGVEDANDPDKHTNFEVRDTSDPVEGKVLLLDCKVVKKDNFKLLTWDSTDNMFITIVRQWGAEYTSYTKDDIKKYQHGWAEFASGENRAKTIAALQYFKNLFNNGIFGLPGNISDSSYASTAFKANQCMFTICSSGGLEYNVTTAFRLRLAPIPYKDADHKYVISQGTNLCLFDQGTEEDRQKAFDAIVAFTTGDLQGAWAAESGYYPASKSATNSTIYQELLAGETAADNATKKAFLESAQLNQNYYMNEETKWVKFVDPGFVGSSVIRAEVGTIMSSVLTGTLTFDEILDESMNTLSNYDPTKK